MNMKVKTAAFLSLFLLAGVSSSKAAEISQTAEIPPALVLEYAKYRAAIHSVHTSQNLGAEGIRSISAAYDIIAMAEKKKQSVPSIETEWEPLLAPSLPEATYLPLIVAIWDELNKVNNAQQEQKISQEPVIQKEILPQEQKNSQEPVVQKEIPSQLAVPKTDEERWMECLNANYKAIYREASKVIANRHPNSFPTQAAKSNFDAVVSGLTTPALPGVSSWPTGLTTQKRNQSFLDSVNRHIATAKEGYIKNGAL
jgi:hypothetical protein